MAKKSGRKQQSSRSKQPKSKRNVASNDDDDDFDFPSLNNSSSSSWSTTVPSAAVALLAAFAAGYHVRGDGGGESLSNAAAGNVPITGDAALKVVDTADTKAANDPLEVNRSLQLDDAADSGADAPEVTVETKNEDAETATPPAPVTPPAPISSSKKKASSSTSSSAASSSFGGPAMEATIAAFHDPSSFFSSFSSQQNQEEEDDVLKYLMYDDGYSACLSEDAVLPVSKSDKWGVRDLKIAKYELLREWMNDESRWVVTLPRDAKGNYAKAEELYEAGRRVEGTCRLITLNHDDLGGRASEVLLGLVELGGGGGDDDVIDGENATENATEASSRDPTAIDEFVLTDSQGYASDYRTMACLARFMEKANVLHPPKNRHEKYGRDVLLSEWADRARSAKQAADKSLLTEETLLPLGWSVTRDKSGYAFYQNPMMPHKATWIRPVVRKGEEKLGRSHAPPGPHEETGKVRHSALTVRNKPCDVGAETTMRFVFANEEEKKEHIEKEERRVAAKVRAMNEASAAVGGGGGAKKTSSFGGVGGGGPAKVSIGTKNPDAKLTVTSAKK